MSKRRKEGDWVRLQPNSGFVCESDRLRAEIQPEDDHVPYRVPCVLCDDPDCREWATLLTEPDPQREGERWMLCHVSECQMNDCAPPEGKSGD